MGEPKATIEDVKKLLDAKFFDANGTLNLGITRIKFVERFLEYEDALKTAMWLNATIPASDLGPGAEQGTIEPFKRHLNALQGKGTGTGPVDPPSGTNSDGRQALTVEEALANAERGYTWRGTLALDDAALQEHLWSRAAVLASLGHWIWDDITDRCLFCSEELARIHGIVRARGGITLLDEIYLGLDRKSVV